MGTPLGGPVPKRSEERRRRHDDVGVEIEKVDLDRLIRQDVDIPNPPTRLNDDGEVVWSWHEIAVFWFQSLAKSGQAIFYEPSDWATAYILAETLSRELSPQPIVTTDADGSTKIEWVKVPIKGSSMNGILKGMTALLTTEGDRRRVRIELERADAKDRALSGPPQLSLVQERSELLG